MQAAVALEQAERRRVTPHRYLLQNLDETNSPTTPVLALQNSTR